MTLTQLTTFVSGIPLDPGSRERLLSALAGAPNVESVDAAVMEEIYALAEETGPDLERQRNESASDLAAAKADLQETIARARQALSDFDANAVEELKKLADQAIAEIDRLEEAAAKEQEMKKKVEEKAQIQALREKMGKRS